MLDRFDQNHRWEERSTQVCHFDKRNLDTQETMLGTMLFTQGISTVFCIFRTDKI